MGVGLTAGDGLALGAGSAVGVGATAGVPMEESGIDGSVCPDGPCCQGGPEIMRFSWVGPGVSSILFLFRHLFWHTPQRCSSVPTRQHPPRVIHPILRNISCWLHPSMHHGTGLIWHIQRQPHQSTSRSLLTTRDSALSFQLSSIPTL